MVEMITRIVVFIWTLLLIKICVCRTETVRFCNSSVQCCNVSVNQLTTKTRYGDKERHIRDVLNIRPEYGLRRPSQRRSLGSTFVDLLPLPNLRYLGRRVPAIRRLLFPTVYNLYKNPRTNDGMESINKDLSSVRDNLTIDDAATSNDLNYEYFNDNSLKTVTPDVLNYTEVITSKSSATEAETFITKYVEITANDFLETTTSVTSTETLTRSSSKVKSPKGMIKNVGNSIWKGYTRKLFQKFSRALNGFERQFYLKTFEKLTHISPVNRQENGISFVQSGLFLLLLLMSLSTVTDVETSREITNCIGVNMTEMETVHLINAVMSKLPSSSDGLRWRWSSRLVLNSSQDIDVNFLRGAGSALRLGISKFNGTDSPETLAVTLNQMVGNDSGGAIRDAFEVDEMSDGVRAVALTTIHFRAQWRSAPTVLNGTRTFRDPERTPLRNVRMIRINDIMRYADFEAWKFQAVEISYSNPNLSLLMLVPYEPSLRSLVEQLASSSLDEIYSRMTTQRVAVSMPIYTLRMTLLLPSKLQAMGINRLVDWNGTDSGNLRLSHAVQRLMFWAEAGRNAFKDDGLEWDETPDMELMVDRPYVFFVRWRNLTLMNGNFLL